MTAICYHGTRADFTKFALGEHGVVCFTSSRHDAEEFARWAGGCKDGTARVITARVTLKNPYHHTAGGELFDPEMWERVIMAAKAGGHDGAIIHDIQNFEFSESTRSYCVFSASAIKIISEKEAIS